MQYNARMWSSETLTVGRAGMKLKHFLFQPPSLIFMPLMHWVHTTTGFLLPPRISRQYNMLPGRFAWIVFVLTYGILRFIYRLLPGSFRYVADYLRVEERMGIQRRFHWLSHISSRVASTILHMAMPPRQHSYKERPKQCPVRI